MSARNFTPFAGKGSIKKKSSSKLKIWSIVSLFVILVGVGVGYIMVSQGFIFQPNAATRGANLSKYGWNGTCFTKFSGSGITNGIDHGARYQCPGPLSLYSRSGCQSSLGLQTGKWDYNKIPLKVGGVSQVCIEPSGASGPKDKDGCFTQQLDIDNGDGGSPEGFYSFDSCTPTTPPVPTPTSIPPSEPSVTPPACVNPSTPPNVHINCPLCNQNASGTQ